MDSGKISKVFLVFLILGLVPLSASVSKVDVLVVNDGHRLADQAELSLSDDLDQRFEERYNNSLRGIEGVEVDYYRTSSETETEEISETLGPSADYMSDYDAVVWYTLADYGGSQQTGEALREPDRKNITDYLDQGGALYLNGHLLQIDLESEEQFYKETLKTQFNNQDSYWRFGGDNLQQGLRYEWYTQSVTANPDNEGEMDNYFDDRIDSVTFKGQGVHKGPIHWHTSAYGEKPSYLRDERYSWKASGLLYAPESGLYRIGIDSDDASDLFIDGYREVSWYGAHGIEYGEDRYNEHWGWALLDKGFQNITVRMQEGFVSDGISVAWTKPGEEEFSTIPAENFYQRPSWKFEGVEARGSTDGEMSFSSDGGVRISGEDGKSVAGSSFDFGLDSSVEPAEAFGVISDSCHNEEDALGEDGVRSCGSADDVMHYQNNISVERGSESYIHLENNRRENFRNFNKDKSFDFRASGGEDSVLVVNTALEFGGSGQAPESLFYGGEKMIKLHDYMGGDGDIKSQVFYLENPPQGDNTLEFIKDGSNTVLLTNTFLYDGVDSEDPVKDNATTSGEADISTSVESNSGDKVIDFLASEDTGMEPDTDYQEELFENFGPEEDTYTWGSMTLADEGQTSMGWDGDDDVAHSVLTLNEVEGKSKYYTELDEEGYSPSSRDHPDEHASAMVKAFPEDYRTVHSAFGFEAIEKNETRNRLMDNILNYLAGPRVKGMEASAGQDIIYTDIDESRYTNDTVNLSATGYNNQNREQIANARFMVSETPNDPEPVLEEGFEDEEAFSQRWSLDDGGRVTTDISSECGVRKGEEAFRFGGDDPYLQSNELNVSGQQDLSVEFWFKMPTDVEGSNCRAPVPEEEDVLFIKYLDSSGNWKTLSSNDSSSDSDARGAWSKIDVPIDDSKLHDNFKIRIQKKNSDYREILIDELELDSNIELVDGTFYTKENVTVRSEGLDATKIGADLEERPSGVNLTYAVQFKDNSPQGYWGIKGEQSIIVDTEAPEASEINFSRDYTNKEMVELTVDHGEMDGRRPNLTRFSCNGYDWTRWKERENNRTQELELDITDTEIGCPTGTGNRTIQAEFRDYAGNVASETSSDEIAYDTEKPTVEGIGPQNDTVIRPTEPFRINASDNYSVLLGEQTVETDSGQKTVRNVYSNGSETNETLEVNETGGLDPFSPDTSGDGILRSYIFDRALNVRRSYFEYDVDSTPPSISSVSSDGGEVENRSPLQSSEDLAFEIKDDYLDTVVVNEGDGNRSFGSSSFTFSPVWSGEGEQQIDVWMNDTAGNRNHTVLEYTVDDTTPYLASSSEDNESYILNSTSIDLDFEDVYSGVKLQDIQVSSEAEIQELEKGLDVTVEPLEDSEGVKTFNMTVPDRAGNLFTPEFRYIIDTVKPDVFTPYTNSGSWSGSKVPVGLKATDDRNLSTINYCVKSEGGSCEPDKSSQPGENVTVEVDCQEGSVCNKTVKYSAEDSAGNVNGTYETDNVLIDRKSPKADVIGPGSGSTVGGDVNLESNASDADSGLKDANYTVYNASNSSEVFAKGDLNESQDFDAEWNSRDEIGTIQSVVFNITAEDKAGNSQTENVTFSVDNSQTSVTIRRPYREYVDEEFELLVEARRPGERLLSKHNYTIYNSSGVIIVSGSQSDLSKEENEISTRVQASELTGDGNYTLNSTAVDEDGIKGSAEAWFVQDTEAPDASLEDINGTWQTGTITISFDASDTRVNDSLYWRYSDDGDAWSDSNNLDYGQGSFDFDTTRCDDDSQNDCRIQLVAEDSAGNTNRSQITFRVDNSEPNSTIQSPQSGKWIKDDFIVERTDEEDVSEISYCQRRANSDSWDVQQCGQDFDVFVGEGLQGTELGCSSQGVNSCEVEIRSVNVLDLDGTDSVNYSIDYEKPKILDIKPEERIINESDKFQVAFLDETSGITYSRWNASGETQELQNKTVFQPDWTESGDKTLKIKLNDSADNLLKKEYIYTFDNEKPELENSTLLKKKGLNNEVRIYRGEGIRFEANISDNVAVKEATVEVEEKGTAENLTMEQVSDTDQDSTWRKQIGERSETGLYNVSGIYIRDEAGNTRSVTEGLPEFRVVDYSFTSDQSSVEAGYERELGFELDFNRTQGIRRANFTIEETEGFSVSEVSCSYSGFCNITENESYWSVTADGGDKALDLSVGSEAFSPEEDTNVTFSSVVQGNGESVDVLFRSPDLTLDNLSCSKSCSLDQFENFTVGLDVLNNDTDVNSGDAKNVSLKLLKDGSLEETEDISTLSSGSSTGREFSNISFDKADEHELKLVVEDASGDYRDRRTLDVEVADIEKPEILETGVTDERININESVRFEARLDDNTGLEDIEANITLVNASDQSENLTLEQSSGVDRDVWRTSYEKTSERGQYNVSKIYVSDGNGNVREKNLSSTFEVSQLEMNASLLDENTTVNSPVDFEVNVTGNPAPVSSIDLNVTDPSGQSELYNYDDVGTRNVISFGQFESSGNHSFQVIVNAGSSIEASTNDTFVEYGEIAVRNLNGNSSELVLPEDESPYNLDWELLAKNGGVRDITTEFETSNSSVLAPIGGGEEGNLSYQENKEFEYSLAANDIGKANLTLVADPENGSKGSEQIKVNITEQDEYPPHINSISTDDTPLNLEESLDFEANVTDNSVIENVTLKIDNPENGPDSSETFMMEKGEEGLYSYSFDNTGEQGFYNYTVKAWDIEGNSDVRRGNFTVTDELKIDVDSDQDSYVKGEEIEFDIEVMDAGGEDLSDYNVSASLSKNGSSVDDSEGGNGVESLTYSVEEEDPPSRSRSGTDLPLTYTLDLSIENDPITEEITREIDVTRILEARNFGFDSIVTPGSEFELRTDWVEPGGKEIGGVFTSYAICDECLTGANDYRRMTFNDTLGKYTATFPAPNEPGEYNIRLIGSDNRGNSESQANEDDPAPLRQIEVVPEGTTINDTEGQEQGQASRGGGGGFSSGPSMEITRQSPPASVPPETDEVSLSVNTNIAAECAYSRNQIPEAVSFEEASDFQSTGGVNHTNSLSIEEGTTYSYSVMCASEEANSTQEVIFSTESLETFTFAAPTSITPGNESVTQFGNSSARIAIYNEKSEPLTVDLGVEGTCCNLSFESGSEEMDSVTIPGDGETNLDLKVYAPLYVEPGSYSGTLTLSSPSENTSRPFNYQVTSHPAVENFTELETRKGLINSSINEYRIAGIDTSNMRKAFENLTGYLAQADEAIERNDLEGLKTAVSEGRAEADRIRGMLDDASWKKYVLLNWWKWAAIFVAIYILFFLIVIVGIPYYRIQTEITRINSQLETAVEARKKGEKQYFQRKIDKDTFNEMMTERQNEVLQLRGEKEDLKEELDGFLMDKLTVENYLKAPWKGMNELEKWWAANRKARENLNQDDEQEEE